MPFVALVYREKTLGTFQPFRSNLDLNFAVAMLEILPLNYQAGGIFVLLMVMWVIRQFYFVRSPLQTSFLHHFHQSYQFHKKS